MIASLPRIRPGRATLVVTAVAILLLPGCKKEKPPEGEGPGMGTGTSGPAPEPQLPPLPEDKQERVEFLVEKLGDRELRNPARKEIIRMGKDATPVLLEHMKDPDFTTRWEMANVQGDIRDDRAVPALVENVLHDDNSHVRWRSIWALNEYQDKSQAVGLLQEAKKSKEHDVRWNAAVGLSMLARDDCRCLDIIHAGVGGDNDWQRWEAINALKRVHDKRSVSVLQPVLSGGSKKDRQEAAMALGDIGKDITTREAVNALVAMLEDAESGVRWRAAQSLGDIADPRSREALESLKELESDERVLEHVDRALTKIAKASSG